MKQDGILATLALQFAVLSLLAVGGANAIVPELHRQAVDIRGWMSERQFADMFATDRRSTTPLFGMMALNVRFNARSIPKNNKNPTVARRSVTRLKTSS